MTTAADVPGTVGADPDVGTTALWADLSRVVSRVRHAVDGRLQEALGLLVSDYDVLAGVAATGGRATMSQLGARAALSPSGVTRAVTRLAAQRMLVVEDGRLLDGVPDRRLSYVRLTAEGESRLDRARGIVAEEVHRRLGRHLDAGARDALRSVLHRLGDT